ncbi:MAG: peptidoglycan DD-metalloendopeptidase family protein [Candidatus Pacebacteria bacterium]|nr:peptidoglycan DD-metalloendopeptidase family protein [Candidatus Paceibacterota bacterium]
MVFCFIALALILVIKSDNKAVNLDQTNLINIDSSLQPITSIITGENNVLSAIPSPLFISSNTLGLIMEQEKDNAIIKYTVGSGETLNQISQKFNVSVETIMLANELTSTKVKEGDELSILPVNGLVHIVEKDETVGGIAKKYSANKDEIIEFNELGDGSVFIGDILIVPNGKMPKPTTQSVASNVPQVVMPNSYFMAPTTGLVTQGAHFSNTVSGVKQYNAIDIANSLGTPIVAAAGGQVQIVKKIWPNGNYVTIAHPNGLVTLYAHLNSFAKDIYPGKQVSQGEVIGYMGCTGKSTGPHLHFQVMGAYNPFLNFRVGSRISY